MPGMTGQQLDFVAFHLPALERHEARHNMLLSGLERHAADPRPEMRQWSFDAPGACAIHLPHRPIILGDLTNEQCRKLADDASAVDYPGVLGPDETAMWFVRRAEENGLAFDDGMPQQIHVLSGPPRYPGIGGSSRIAGREDASLFADWMTGFVAEAQPHEAPPDRKWAEPILAQGRHFFWIVDDEPVAMAGIVRRTRNISAISWVYTPPALRGRGYAGSVTAAVVERIFAEGKSAVCLYTDLRNPASNRCYAKIGFRPVCRSWHYNRRGRLETC